MDPGDPLPFDNVRPNVPRQKNKRRSSILKPSGTRPVLQDLNPNVRVPDPPIVTYNVEKRKSRRVSFSRTQQVKEFQPGQNNLTVWNDTYEEEKSNASSNSTGVNATNTTHTTTSQVNPRVQQLQAGQLTTVSPSKALPLNIAIPAGASPNKFLPSGTVDTGDFLQSLGQPQVDSVGFLASLGGERDRRDSEDSNIDHDSSFVKMLNKISDVVPASQTVVGEVDMSATMMDVSMFQHGEEEDEEEDSTGKLDTLGFLAGLAGSPAVNKTSLGGGMDMTMGCNTSNRVEGLEQILGGGGMDMTCAPSKGGVDMTVMGGGMDVTMAPNKTVLGGGMDETIGSNLTVLGGGMDVTLAPNKTVLGGGMDVTLAPNKTVLGGGMETTLVGNKTTLGGAGMDMTMAPDADLDASQDSVFENSMLAEFKASLAAQGSAARPNTADLIASLSAHHPTADELPGSLSAHHPTADELPGSLSAHHPTAEELPGSLSAHHPTADELPGSLPASANSSIDYGATATVKFSGLALANNTLLLPRKESEEDEDDGMTKCPVQFFSYDPSKPVLEHGQAAPQLNRTSSGDADMEITEAVPTNLQSTDLYQGSSGAVQKTSPSIPQTAEKLANLENMSAPSKPVEQTRYLAENMEMTVASCPPAEMEMTQAVEHPAVSAHQTSSLSLFSPVVGAISSASDSELVSSSDSRDLPRPGDLMDITKPVDNLDITKPGEDLDITKPEEVIASMNAGENMDFTRPCDEMDITKPGDNMDITKSEEKAVPQIEVEEPESVDDSGWETIHNTLNIPPDNQPSSTPPIVACAGRLKTQGELLREKFPSPISEDPSPDRTEMVGMMPKFNESVWDGDVTSFFPRGESTRAINFPIPAVCKKKTPTQDISPLIPQISKKSASLEVGDVTSFFPGGESTRAINFPIPVINRKSPTLAVESLPQVAEIQSPNKCQERSPLVHQLMKKTAVLELGEVTSFFPPGESTRAVNFPIPPPPVTKSPVMPQLSSLASPKVMDLEVGDVTSFFPRGESTRAVNFPLHSSQPPTVQVSSAQVEKDPEIQPPTDEPQPIQDATLADLSLEQVPIVPPVSVSYTSKVPKSESMQLDLTKPSDVSVSTQQEAERKEPCQLAKLELTASKIQEVVMLENTCELTNLDVTTPEMQQERDEFWEGAGEQQAEPESILPAVEITAAPGDCGCHVLDGVGYQHVDCKEHDNRSPQIKRGVEEQCCGTQGAESKKQRMSIEPECSITRSDMERDLEGSYVQKDVSKTNHSADSLSCSISVKDRLKNLTQNPETPSQSPEQVARKDDVIMDVNNEPRNELTNVATSNEVSIEQANSTRELVPSDSTDTGMDSSPVLCMPSLSFRDLSQRLLQSRVKSQGEESSNTDDVEPGDNEEPADNITEMIPSKTDVQETNLPMSESSLVYSDEKMIHEEGEPSFLANISDNISPDKSPAGQIQLAQSLVASFVEPIAVEKDEIAAAATNTPAANNVDIGEEIVGTEEEVKLLSFDYELMSKPTNTQACDFSPSKSVSMSSIETLQTSNNPLVSLKDEEDGPRNVKVDPVASGNEIRMDTDNQERDLDFVILNKIDPKVEREEDMEIQMAIESTAHSANIGNAVEDGEVKDTFENNKKGPTVEVDDPVFHENPSTNILTKPQSDKIVIEHVAGPSYFSQEELTIFADLVSRQVSPDQKDPARWRLVSHCTQSNTAVYSWLENSLVLVLHLGEKLKPKKSRKSLGRPVGHWAVSKLYLTSLHRDQTSQDTDPVDQVFDAAHFSVTRKFPESALRSQCPNTYSLSSLLKSISAYVTPAHSFFKALNHVRHNFYPFSVSGNLVTVGFVSQALGQAFDIQVDFSEGFGSAPETFRIVKTIGPVNKEMLTKLVSGVNPGPEYIREVASRVEQYLVEKERRLGGQKKNTK